MPSHVKKAKKIIAQRGDHVWELSKWSRYGERCQVIDGWGGFFSFKIEIWNLEGRKTRQIRLQHRDLESPLYLQSRYFADCLVRSFFPGVRRLVYYHLDSFPLLVFPIYVLLAEIIIYIPVSHGFLGEFPLLISRKLSFELIPSLIVGRERAGLDIYPQILRSQAFFFVSPSNVSVYLTLFFSWFKIILYDTRFTVVPLSLIQHATPTHQIKLPIFKYILMISSCNSDTS